MKSKVFLSLAMCISILLSFCACGTSDYESRPTSELESQTEVQSDTEISSDDITNAPKEQSPNQNKNAKNSSDTDIQKEYNYIGNSNTLKFHKPNCISIEQMNESNEVYLNGSRDDAISKGYKPCKRCKP